MLGDPRTAKKRFVHAHELVKRFQNKISRKNNALLKLENGLFLSKLGKAHNLEKARLLLFEALEIFVLDAATNERCKELAALQRFKSADPKGKLTFISNATREIAHCMAELAKVFHFQGDMLLAKEYLEKARDLGLQYLIETETDNLTRATILLDFGAMRIIGQTLKNPNLAGSLHPEILLSVIEHIGTIEDEQPITDQFAKDLEQQINRIMAEDNSADLLEGGEPVTKPLLRSVRNHEWYKRAVESLKKINPHHYSAELAEFVEVLGDLLQIVQCNDFNTIANEIKSAVSERILHQKYGTSGTGSLLL